MDPIALGVIAFALMIFVATSECPYLSPWVLSGSSAD